MRIPLHLLETLRILQHEKTLAQTAARLQCTQPTVTRQLQQIQTFFKTPLFGTQGKGKVLSDFGRALAKLAETRLNDIDVAIAQIKFEHEDVDSLPLTIGGRGEVLGRVFQKIELPNPISIISVSGPEVASLLSNQEIDLAISHQNIDSIHYIRKKLFTDQMGLAIPKSAIGAHQDWRDWIKSFPKLPFSHYRPVDGSLEQIFPPQYKPECHLSFSDWGFLEERIALGLNWGLLPSSFVKSKASYRFFEIETISPQQFYLYFRKSLLKSLAVQKILAKSN